MGLLLGEQGEMEFKNLTPEIVTFQNAKPQCFPL